jgi:predicted nucleic acid-binding protein
MVFLLDSNVISDLIRKHPRVEARLAALNGDDRVVTCPIVRGEILYGVEHLPEGRRRSDLTRQAETIFSNFRCEPLPPDAGDAYARIKNAQQRKGLTLDENDLWIAAAASAIGATLVTRDTDFNSIEGLAIVDWTAT